MNLIYCKQIRLKFKVADNLNDIDQFIMIKTMKLISFKFFVPVEYNYVSVETHIRDGQTNIVRVRMYIVQLNLIELAICRSHLQNEIIDLSYQLLTFT